MKTVKLLTLVSLLAGVLFLSSCNDDDAPAKSRDIRFEVSGNFTGDLNVTFITASGGGTSEDITALPWVKSITYASTVPSTAITVAGGGGVAGQTITLKVFAGGDEVSSTPATANSNGIVAVTAPPYIF
jgi:hypothetical protein